MQNSPIGTDTRKIRRQLMGASNPPTTRPMNVPLVAATPLIPRAMPRWLAGKASVRMAAELAKSMAPPTPWKIRPMIRKRAPALPCIQVTREQQGKEGEDGEAQVVDPHSPVHVAQAAQADDQHAGHHHEAEDHPQQVEAVARQERVEADAPEDGGHGDQDDRGVDRHHQDAHGGVDQGDPLVALGSLTAARGEPPRRQTVTMVAIASGAGDGSARAPACVPVQLDGFGWSLGAWSNPMTLTGS